MPRTKIRKYLPTPQDVRKNKNLRMMGEVLHEPDLWHCNRRTIAGALGVGLFVAFLPIPFQTLVAAFAAILLRLNLPVSIVSVWITNPLTFPVLFYMAYRIGAYLTGASPQSVEFALSWEWLSQDMVGLWLPFIVGCIVCGVVAGLSGYTGVRLIWRWVLIRNVRRRRNRGRAAVGPR